MPCWWGKSSSKEEKKKANKESLLDAPLRKLSISSDDKSNSRSVDSRGCNSHIASGRVYTWEPFWRQRSPSTRVACCGLFSTRLDPGDAEGDIATALVSSDRTIASDDPSESHFLSHLTSDHENGIRTAANSPSRLKHEDQSPTVPQKNSREALKPAELLPNNEILSTSRKRRPLTSHVQNIQIPTHGAFCSAPDSSLSSPSRSQMRVYGPEQVWNSGPCSAKPSLDIAFLGSGHFSSPGSGHNSGHNSGGGDMSGQLFWPHSRCSPECSPMRSPRMTSPGLSSRIHSGAVNPLHPRAGVAATESSTSHPNEEKQQSHRLPLPPIAISNTCPFSPTYSAAMSPSLPRSPGWAESSFSPGCRWKKGKLLGRGLFGHVYLGFNSESGEMCAMKEVPLCSDDAISRESALQLGQEILVLSCLRHANIVQYYGSETIDDKLYIYLEYVSGGSIYRLLREYGPFGEVCIRNYTQQILLGLAYLHAKSTVHRDIKGANILVDPNGRVKLADFGLAKHIAGQPCPFSVKGSPYWMAPEVIRNSNGCNLAVDIWSLGCTVLEMFTTKPPWSQYEWVAAMFKIGSSEELPAIPDHLTDQGKDFVRQCLQRNPSYRPSAAQLLEHPFVKNAAPLERPIFSADPSDSSPAATNAIRTLVPSHGLMGIQNASAAFPLSPLGKACLRMDLTAVHEIPEKIGHKDDEGAAAEETLNSKKKGDAAFRHKDFRAAIECYTQNASALPLSPLGEACLRLDLTAVHEIREKIGYKDDEGAATEMWTNQMQETLTSKKKGDAAFRHKDFRAAIGCYTQFIDVGTRVSPTVYARRSLSYLISDMPQEAINDALQAQVTSPVWHIASYLRAAALWALGKDNEAQTALMEGSILESKRNGTA